MKCTMKHIGQGLVALLITLLCTVNVRSQQVVTFKQFVSKQHTLLHECDLIFVVNNAGNAITESTQAHGDWPIDHVAVFHRDSNGSPCVIQAVHKGVCLEPLDSLIAEAATDGHTPMLLIGRVTGVDTIATIKKCLSFVGKPYDHYFAPSDSAIYCSELVQKSFIDAKGHLIFEPIAMSFHGPDGVILPYWTEHYRRIGSRVPEGAPGTNPAELSRRPQVALLYLVKAL